MKKKQMVWMRIVVLPISLFTLIVALDQNQSWLVVLAIVLIVSIILWWYLDEIHDASSRKVLEENVLDIASLMGVNNAKLMLIEEDLKKPLLMEKLYTYETGKIKKVFSGIYQGVSFDYKEVECKGSRNFDGHVLTLFLKGSVNEQVAMYDVFPYNEEIKHKTIVASNEEKLEISVEGLWFFKEVRTENIKASIKRLLDEITIVVQAVEVKQ